VKGSGFGLIEVLFRHLYGGTEETHEENKVSGFRDVDSKSAYL
jgi:hypothetical protein